MRKSKTVKNKYGASADKCWLGFFKLDDTGLAEKYENWCTSIVAANNSPIIQNALDELVKGIKEILGIKCSISESPQQSSYLLMGTFENNQALCDYVPVSERDRVNEEGFIIKHVRNDNKNIMLIAAKSEKGLLYGVFGFLRAIQTQIEPESISKMENPRNNLRMIDHWDNMDGNIERGYAGKSIFFNNNKIVRDTRRIKDYARLLSSTGINSVVINNVNVHQFETQLIAGKYLKDVARLADLFRNYGIKLFLSVNFASPIELGKLTTADPLDTGVQNWWKNKAGEIYNAIPDFGGFLIKADSEFRPGPFTYGRSHADGANMLAEAVREHGGIVIWRCFVYNCLQDWRDRTVDRAKAAYDNFMPLDGSFYENVCLQIKNGPMDFQVREPVSPLIGGLQKTNITMELQITQEYTGQQKHLCYLIPMWKEILDFDTCSRGEGTKVRDIVSGSVFGNKLGGLAAVANIGDDPNWTGFQLAQANLYGYARLAWNPELSVQEITEEWVRMTFSNDKKVVGTISDMLLHSWKIYENYTAPLGIGWMVNPNHHYGPNVDGYEYARWGTYHRADSRGIGVDRTVRSGTGFVGQYHKKVADIYEEINTCPQELLLFFHRIPYEYRLKSGETLIQYIYDTHFDGVDQVLELKNKWLGLSGRINEELFLHVLGRLEGQLEHAKEWRDVINSYFYRKTGIDDKKGRKIY